MHFKLTQKLLLPLAGCIILGLGTAIFMANLTAKKILQKNALQSLHATADSGETQISEWLNRNILDVETLAGLDIMTLTLTEPDVVEHQTAVNRLLKNFVDKNKIFSGVRLSDPKGLVKASCESKFIGSLNVGDRQYHSAAMRGETFISQPLVSKTTGQPILVIATPVKQQNSIVGVLYAVIDLNSFTNNWLNGLKVGETGYVFMTNQEGLIIAHPDNKLIMDLNIRDLSFGNEIISKKNGILPYVYKGDRKLAAFKQVPKTEWILVANVLEKEAFKDALKIRNMLIIIGIIITTILCIAIIILVSFFVIKPIHRLVAGVKSIEGDLTKKLVVTSKDELGDLASWFNTFLESLRQTIKNIAEDANQVGAASSGFLTISSDLATQARESSNRAQALATASEKVSISMQTITGNMEKTSENTTMVAAATEQMTATINEIAGNSEKAKQISSEAVHQASTVSSKVSELGKAAQSIGAFTQAITDISEQTNLLALNATIEAARAGDAGKGFAVVAGEIKDLALQTAKATNDIKEKITDIQNTTTGTANEIEAISRVITDVNEIISTIAESIQEQSVATSEISTNVSQTSRGIEDATQNVTSGVSGIEEINNDIASLNATSDKMSEESNDVAVKARQLEQMASELGALVGRFKY